MRQAPTSVPIYQTATFSSGDAEELAAVLTGEQPGYAYSRIDNPTVVALGDAVAELHGAEAGIALATGMAAIHATFLSLLRAGDRLVIGQVGYGTTRTQAAAAFGRLGVDVAYVDTTDVDAVEASLAAARTRILHVETIANPTCVLADLPALAEVAHRHGALLTVDNTFASPAVCRPLEHGADLVMESGTKYLSGHSDVMAGAVVGSRDRVAAVRSAQIDTGATLGPFAAFLVLRGIATVAVRVERQSRTALALADVPRGSRRRRGRHLPGAAEPPPARGRGADPRPRRRDAVGRPGRRPGRRAGRSSTPSRSRSGPPAWAASTRWWSTRRRRPTARSTRRRWPPRASPRASSGCRSAWRTRRTSWPTSRRRSRRRTRRARARRARTAAKPTPVATA